MEIEISKGEEYYGIAAEYYDLVYSADPKLKDLDFYLTIAKEYGGRILEVGCGTGRILLPLLATGMLVDGIEPSNDLINILKTKALASGLHQGHNGRILQGRLQELNLDRRYDLVIAPFRVLQHLYTSKDQIQALRRVHEHLVCGGFFVFDVFKPNYKFFESVGIEHPETSFTDPRDAANKISRSFVLRQVNSITQELFAELKFTTICGDTVVRDHISNLRMSYFHYPQIEMLLEFTGFKVRETFGSFDRTTLGSGNELIVVAQKVSSNLCRGENFGEV